MSLLILVISMQKQMVHHSPYNLQNMKSKHVLGVLRFVCDILCRAVGFIRRCGV